MAPLYVGGCVRALAERGRAPRGEGEGDPGVLAASGLVAGEGLAGVLVAGLVALGLAPKSIDPRLGGLAGETAALRWRSPSAPSCIAAGAGRRGWPVRRPSRAAPRP